MGATAVTPAAGPRKGLGGVSARLLRVASDEKLVAAVRQGSQPAFEVVYDRHHRGILSFCRHMLSSREEAEDAVQHTFMAAYKALMGSDKDIQLKAWLYTIARNRCLSVLRARREHASDEIEIASFDGLAAQVERKVDLQDMLRDLAELPEDQRAALVLSEIGDLGHDEIARVLDVEKDKVKALVFQARSSLPQSREARDTSCEEIREMLATLSGGSLRRTTLRRHVKSCAGCAAFEADVKRQRRAMAAVLPVVPTIGLKENALAAAFGQSAAGGAAVAGGAAAVTAGSAAGGSALAGGGASALVAKVLVVATVAGGGAAGVNAVTSDGERAGTSRSTPASETGRPAGGPAAPVPAAAPAEAEEQTDKAVEEKPRKSRKGRARGKDDRGKDFAKSRGKGKKRGLNGTQPGQAKKAEKKKEKAKEKAEQRQAREKSREQKAKAKSREKAKRQRPAKPPARKPQPQPQSKPAKPQQNSKPEPKPEPTPEPTPSVVPDVTPEPSPDPGKTTLKKG